MKKMLALLATARLLSSSTASADDNADVLDIDGNKVQAGAPYYVISAIRGPGGGGGVTLRPIYGGSPCPLYVVQEPFEGYRGLPVKLHPLNPNDTTIHLQTDLNVEFDTSTKCEESTVWELAMKSREKWKYVIRTGGIVGNPGQETMSNWFKIVRGRGHLSNAYMMMFCPSVCVICPVLCGYVGLLDNEGRYLRHLTHFPFVFEFQKA